MTDLRALLGERYDVVMQAACGCDGTRLPHCYECSDSTWDHECPDPVPCRHRAAESVLARVLPDLLDAAAERDELAAVDLPRADPQPVPRRRRPPMTDLYARLGIDFDQLGCVMLDCEPPTFLHDLVPPTFWYRDPARPGEYGPEMQAHVTLLFGLLRNANTIRAEVDEVLEGWRAPEFFEASKRAPLEMFGGPDAPYDCIVLRPSYDLGYSDAHRRLSRLPHINTFPDYQAHVTVGYVIKGAGKYLLPDLERALSERRTPLQLAHAGLNYGRAEGEPYA